MADVRVDDRDLRLLLGALEEFLASEDWDFTSAEWDAYQRTCKLIGRKHIKRFEQQSLGFLADDEPPHPDEPRPSGRGIMADYIDRTRHMFGRGGEGMPWPPPHSAPPKPDPAKAIADKMARASHDAATGKSTPATPKPAEPKRALTDEEKRALREALGDE